MVARMLNDEHGEMYTLAVRFSNSLTNLLHPICEARHLLPEEEKNAVIQGLKRIYRKANCPLDDQNTDEVVAIGHMTQILARDIAIVLKAWHEDNAAHARMIVRLEEAEQNFTVLLDDVRKWRSNLNNNF